MGRSTDSNMCRALFNDCKYFSTVLSLDIDFILGKKNCYWQPTVMNLFLGMSLELSAKIFSTSGKKNINI